MRNQNEAARGRDDTSIAQHIPTHDAHTFCCFLCCLAFTSTGAAPKHPKFRDTSNRLSTLLLSNRMHNIAHTELGTMTSIFQLKPFANGAYQQVRCAMSHSE